MEAGELNRFETAVLPYLDSAHTLARYLLRDPHDAEDAVQEAYLRALRHFAGFRGEEPRAWLLTIVRNTCHSWRHRHRRDALATEFNEELHSEEIGEAGPAAELERSESIEDLREALERLPAQFREVLVLRELEELSYKEIAHIIGAPVGTVMSRLARARDRLQQLVRTEREGGDQ